MCFFGNKFVWAGVLIYLLPSLLIFGVVFGLALTSLPPGDYSRELGYDASGGGGVLVGILMLVGVVMLAFPFFCLMFAPSMPIISAAVFLYYAFAYSALYFFIRQDRRRKLQKEGTFLASSQ